MLTTNPNPHYLEKELHALCKKTLFSFIEDGSLDGVWYWDLSKKQNMWISPRFWHILGHRAEDMAHLTSEWRHVVFDEDFKVMMEKLSKHLKDPLTPYNQVVRYQNKSGSTVWMRTRAMAIRGRSGKPLRILAMHNNLTHTIKTQDDNKVYKDEIEELTKQLEKETTHDEVTQLYNRRGIEENYKYLIEVAKRDGSFLSIMLISMDFLNHVYDQETMDKIYQAFTKALWSITRHIDIKGRFDQHEFMLLMPNTTKEHAIMVAQRIEYHIAQEPLEGIRDMKLRIGLATRQLNLADDTQSTYDILNLYVDEALHLAKKEEYNNIVHYQDLHQQAFKHLK